MYASCTIYIKCCSGSVDPVLSKSESVFDENEEVEVTKSVQWADVFRSLNSAVVPVASAAGQALSSR